VRIAMTETCSVYAPMPARIEDLPRLAGHLDELRAANVSHHVDLIAQAAEAGAQIVGLGELFAAPYFALGEITDEVQDLWRSLAEDSAAGPTITALRAAAKMHEVTLIAPIYELDATTQKRFNTAVVIDETGCILGKYRKNHIPAGSNEQGTFQETLFYGPSDGAMGNDPAFNVSTNPHYPVFQTTHAKIGVSICYDRHFEGVVRALSSNGAELIFSPAVTFGAHSQRMWGLEFQVDAARHNVFIAGSNRKGSEPPWNQEYFGASYVTGPNGRIEARSSAPCLILADLDLTQLASGAGSGWDLARDRRADTYDR
jgi:N-carbamoylputrescine amidase